MVTPCLDDCYIISLNIMVVIIVSINFIVLNLLLGNEKKIHFYVKIKLV